MPRINTERALLPWILSVGAILLTVGNGSVALGQTSLLKPQEGIRSVEPNPPPVAGAKVASKAAAMAATEFNERVVAKVVEDAIARRDEEIKSLLETTGQKGVLVRVDIQRTDGELPFYSVVGGEVAIVGAGSGPGAVALAASQTSQLRAGLSPGAKLDANKSYYLWFTKGGEGIIATFLTNHGVTNEVARLFADSKLLAAANDMNGARSLEAAVEFSSANIKQASLRQELLKFKKQEEQLNKTIADIDNRLSRELAKARRAQETARSLGLLAGVLSLASQASAVRDSLGEDAPASLDNVKTFDELKGIANAIVERTNGTVNAIQVERGFSVNQRQGLRSDYMKIIVNSGYPVNQVPELRVPALP